MLGVVLDRGVAKQAVTAGLDHGLILNAPSDTVIRLTPPLIISDEEIGQAVDALTDLLTTLTKEA